MSVRMLQVGRNGTGKTTLLRALAVHQIKGIPANMQVDSWCSAAQTRAWKGLNTPVPACLSIFRVHRAQGFSMVKAPAVVSSMCPPAKPLRVLQAGLPVCRCWRITMHKDTI